MPKFQGRGLQKEIVIWGEITEKKLEQMYKKKK